MQKTTGPLQQHLRLNVRNMTRFTEALEIVYNYIKSRHLVVPSRNDGPVDMDIGALKIERKERIQRKRKRIWIQRQRNVQRKGQRKEQRFQTKEKKKKE